MERTIKVRILVPELHCTRLLARGACGTAGGLCKSPRVDHRGQLTPTASNGASTFLLASVAKWPRHAPAKRAVTGSIPSRRSKLFTLHALVAQWIEQTASTRKIEGPSPSESTSRLRSRIGSGTEFLPRRLQVRVLSKARLLRACGNGAAPVKLSSSERSGCRETVIRFDPRCPLHHLVHLVVPLADGNADHQALRRQAS